MLNTDSSAVMDLFLVVCWVTHMSADLPLYYPLCLNVHTSSSTHFLVLNGFIKMCEHFKLNPLLHTGINCNNIWMNKKLLRIYGIVISFLLCLSI